MDYMEMTAPCGLACWLCPVHLADSDPELRANIAKALGVEEDKARCKGCRAEGGCIEVVGMTEPCKVWRCKESNGIEICSSCDDFPCDNLHPYADRAQDRPHNTKVFNLALIRKMGLEAWAQEKASLVLGAYFKGKLEL